MVATADYSYFRLRDEGYGPGEIAAWARKIDAHSKDAGDAFVYFKHEKEGRGAEFAKIFTDNLAA